MLYSKEWSMCSQTIMPCSRIAPKSGKKSHACAKYCIHCFLFLPPSLFDSLLNRKILFRSQREDQDAQPAGSTAKKRESGWYKGGERETKIKSTSPSLRTSSSHSCRRSSWTKFSSLPPFSFPTFCAFLHYLFLPSSFFSKMGCLAELIATRKETHSDTQTKS